MLQLYNGVLFSNKKRNIQLCEKTWWTQKCTELTERGHLKTAVYGLIPIIWVSGKGKGTETVKITVVTRGIGCIMLSEIE